MAAEDKSTNGSQKVNSTSPSMKMVGISVVVIVGALLVFMAGVGVERHHSERLSQTAGLGFVRDLKSGPGWDRQAGFGMEHGMTMREDNQNLLRGVVTAVNGDSFTLAGNGATNTVQTTSKTTYSGGDKVSVNDTAAVAGTTNNGTFTATAIRVNP